MINSAVAHDWDGDGHVDVLTSFDNKVVLLKGSDWEEHIIDRIVQGRSRNKVRTGCMHSCLMDVDDDGDLDFVGSNSTVFWLECPDDPFSGKPWTYRVVDDEILGTHCLITGDVNRDGTPDLIANSGRAAGTEFPHALAWLEVPKNPHEAEHWIRHVFAPPGDAPNNSHYAGFGDVNGDSRIDAVTCSKDPEDGQTAWFENAGDGTFTQHIIGTGQGSYDTRFYDMDNDGDLDVLIAGHTSANVVWFENPGVGSGKPQIRPRLLFADFEKSPDQANHFLRTLLG